MPLQCRRAVSGTDGSCGTRSDQRQSRPVALEFPFDTEAEEPSVAATAAAEDDIPAPAYQPQMEEPEQMLCLSQRPRRLLLRLRRNANTRSNGSVARGCRARARDD